MAFKDEYEDALAKLSPKGEELTDVVKVSVHEIANKAADNFLTLLCRDVK